MLFKWMEDNDLDWPDFNWITLSTDSEIHFKMIPYSDMNHGFLSKGEK